MLDSESYLGYEEDHFSVEALRSAVCYSAICSMSEEQCQSVFHASKSIVAADYRVFSEGAIERAGLVTTNDITVLQAFVLYLVSNWPILYESHLPANELSCSWLISV